MRYLMVCLLALSSCAGEHVSDAGVGRHTVTATSTKGIATARDDAVRLANKYCRRSGQQAVIESADPQRLAGVLDDPAMSIVFRCGTPNTTAFSR
jgi:hypothetical protein